jgi:transcriptional regulator with XRE-family HTH domain
MKNELNIEIGKRVREQREFMGYTRERFAEELGISARFAADIELGTKGMSFTTFKRVCELLSVSADYLIFGKSNQPDMSKLNRLTSNIDEEYLPLAEDLIQTFIKIIVAAKGSKSL